MRKSISISIRVSEDELEKFKEAARLEAYASYSEFVRRTALIEATRIIKETMKEKIPMNIISLFSGCGGTRLRI